MIRQNYFCAPFTFPLSSASLWVYRQNRTISSLPIRLDFRIFALNLIGIIWVDNFKIDLTTNMNVNWRQWSHNTLNSNFDYVIDLWVILQVKNNITISLANTFQSHSLLEWINFNMDNFWMWNTVGNLWSLDVESKAISMFILEMYWQLQNRT
jgi:hypothetical protein